MSRRGGVVMGVVASVAMSAMAMVGQARLRTVDQAAAGNDERCVFERETEDGLNKICYYSCASGAAAITIKSYQLCPITISR